MALLQRRHLEVDKPQSSSSSSSEPSQRRQVANTQLSRLHSAHRKFVARTRSLKIMCCKDGDEQI